MQVISLSTYWHILAFRNTCIRVDQAFQGIQEHVFNEQIAVRDLALMICLVRNMNFTSTFVPKWSQQHTSLSGTALTDVSILPACSAGFCSESVRQKQPARCFHHNKQISQMKGWREGGRGGGVGGVMHHRPDVFLDCAR